MLRLPWLILMSLADHASDFSWVYSVIHPVIYCSGTWLNTSASVINSLESTKWYPDSPHQALLFASYQHLYHLKSALMSSKQPSKHSTSDSYKTRATLNLSSFKSCCGSCVCGVVCIRLVQSNWLHHNDSQIKCHRSPSSTGHWRQIEVVAASPF